MIRALLIVLALAAGCATVPDQKADARAGYEWPTVWRSDAPNQTHYRHCVIQEGNELRPCPRR